jgi:hypothetical protein
LIEFAIDDLLASSLIHCHPTFFVGRCEGKRVRIVLDTPRIKVAHIPRAHPDKALTAVHVRNLRKPGKYCDGNGLYLVVDPSGAKRWLLRTVILGKRCDLGLGSVRLVSLKEARDEAAQIRRKARDGEDPLADRRRTSVVVPTFKEAAETVHKAHSATFKNEKHRAQWLASLKADVFPLLGGLRVSTIQSGDVLKVLSARLIHWSLRHVRQAWTFTARLLTLRSLLGSPIAMPIRSAHMRPVLPRASDAKRLC